MSINKFIDEDINENELSNIYSLENKMIKCYLKTLKLFIVGIHPLIIKTLSNW